MKTTFYIILSFIVFFLNCSEQKNSNTKSDKNDNLPKTTLKKNLLYLGFWEGMNASQQKVQIDLEIKNGNLNPIKENLHDYDYNPFEFNLYVINKNVSFEMNSHFDSAKLSYIDIKSYDHNVRLNDNSVKYYLSNNSFNNLLGFYKSKYGDFKTKDLYSDASDNFFADVKSEPIKTVWHKFNTLYIWEIEEKVIVIEKCFSNEKNDNEVKISYYPKKFNYLEPYLKYYHTSDDTIVKPINTITKNNI